MYSKVFYILLVVINLVIITKQQCWCQSIDSDGYCVSCLPYCGLQGSNYNCWTCNLNCITCDNTACDSCSTNYYKYSGQCYPCTQPNCILYQPNTNKCQKCDVGYGVDFVVDPYSCQPCDPSCQDCSENVSNCVSCLPAHHKSMGVCIPCPTNCQVCNTSATTCDQCKAGTGLNETGVAGVYECLSCTVASCIECYSNATKCYKCSSPLGVNYTSNKCQPCLSHCINCTTNINVCSQCQSGWGVYYNGSAYMCTICQNGNCLQCSANYSVCTSCILGYAVVGQTCHPCSDSFCYDCTADVSICVQCNSPRGIHGFSCRICESSCATCSPFNYQECTSCYSGNFLDGTNCQACVGNCKTCSNDQICDVCFPNFFLNTTDGQCYPFPPFCTQVYYNVTAQWPQCTACQQYFNVTMQGQRRCDEICGDHIAFLVDCDNGIGVPYDGCSNQCQIEQGFTCQKNSSNISLCSYKDQLQMTITSCIRDQLANSFTLTVQIYPPLYVFTISDVNKVFNLRNDIVKVKSVQFDASKSQLTFKVDFFASFLNQLVIVDFLPSEFVNRRYFDSINASTQIKISLDYYSDFALKISVATPYLCQAIIVIGWIGCLFSLFLKRLAGLEAMFVLQIAFLCMVWLNSQLYLPFAQTFPLQYAVGYSPAYFKTPNDQSINLSSSSMSFSNSPFPQLSPNYPHTKAFSIDEQIIANNFNIFLCIQVSPLLILFFVLIIIKLCEICFKKAMEEQQGLQNYQLSVGVNSSLVRIRKCILFLEQIKEICFQWFMFFSFLNLSHYISSSILFLKLNPTFFQNISNNTLNNIPNLVALFVPLLLYLLLYVLFYKNPDPFNYFRYSFKREKPAILQYYFYPLTILVCTFFLTFLPHLPFLPLIPLLILLIYTLKYKPYRQTLENYRASFYMFVIFILLSFRVYMQYIPFLSKNTTSTYIFHFFNLIFLLVVVLMTIPSLIYHVIFKYYIQPKQQKNEKQKVMCELDILNVRQKMREIESKDSIFHQIITPRMNIFDFSKELHNECYEKATDDDPDTEERINTLSTNKQLKQLANTNVSGFTTRRIKQQLDGQKVLGTKSKKNIAQRAQQFLATKQKDYYPQTSKMKQQQIVEFNKRIFALELVTEENKYIRLKNAHDYTAHKIRKVKQKYEDSYLDDYEDIEKGLH